MIRRWSCITPISFDVKGLVTFNEYTYRKLFRRSVKFKKFHFKTTRFKRRHLRKLRHKATWAVYYNSIKYWTDAVRIAKQYARFQYRYRMFVNNSVVTDGTTLIRRRDRMFLTQDQWVIATLTRCLFLTTGGLNNINVLKSHRGSYHSLAFFLDEEITGNALVVPTISLFDKQFFVIDQESNLELQTFDTVYSFLLDLQINQLSEIYKIITILYLYNLLNLNINVPWLSNV